MVRSDPRFQAVDKKSSKIKVDSRFKDMFTKDSFQTVCTFRAWSIRDVLPVEKRKLTGWLGCLCTLR